MFFSDLYKQDVRSRIMHLKQEDTIVHYKCGRLANSNKTDSEYEMSLLCCCSAWLRLQCIKFS